MTRFARMVNWDAFRIAFVILAMLAMLYAPRFLGRGRPTEPIPATSDKP